MKTRISCPISISSLPFDILREICKFLDVRTLLRIECSNKTLRSRISRNSGDFIWKDQAKAEGIVETHTSGHTGAVDKETHSSKSKELLIRFLQIKMEWMTFSYSPYHEFICNKNEDEVRGVNFLALGSNFTFYSTSWSGHLTEWRIAQKPACSEPGLDPTLFNSWFLSPPPTPKADYFISLPRYRLQQIQPFKVKGIQKVNEAVIRNRLRITSELNGSFLLGSDQSVTLLTPTAFDQYNQYDQCNQCDLYRENTTASYNKITLNSNQSAVSCLAMSQQWAIGASQNLIYCWPLKDFLSKSTTAPPYSNVEARQYTFSRESIKYLSFLNKNADDCSLVLAMCLNGDFFIFDLISYKVLVRWSSLAGLSCGCLVQGQGRIKKSWRVWAGYKDGNIRSWTLTQSSSLFTTTPHPPLCSLGDSITCLAVYESLIIAGAWDGHIRIFDSKTASGRRTLSDPENKSPVLSVLHLSDATLVSGHYNGSITVWDFTKESLI